MNKANLAKLTTMLMKKDVYEGVSYDDSKMDTVYLKIFWGVAHDGTHDELTLNAKICMQDDIIAKFFYLDLIELAEVIKMTNKKLFADGIITECEFTGNEKDAIKSVFLGKIWFNELGEHLKLDALFFVLFCV